MDCGTGLFFAASNLAAATEVARLARDGATQGDKNAALSHAMNTGFQAPMLANIVNTAAHISTRAPRPSSRTTISEMAHGALVEDMVRRGGATFNSLAGASANQTASAAPAAGARAAAPAVADPSLQAVREISIAAEVAGHLQTAVLHLSGNDVTLTTTATTPGIGIGIVFSPRDEAGTVLLTANRVTTPNLGTTAAAILFPTIAAVTGNVFIQGLTKSDPIAPGFVMLAERISAVEVMANAIFASAIILPERNATAPTPSWNFVNTVE
jgi:hypothetical protein